MFGDLDVPHVGAIAAAVGHDVTGYPAQLGRFKWQAATRATTVHTDDDVGYGQSRR